MSRLLLAAALLGMIALAAAVDADVQKKHYKHEEEEHEKHKSPTWREVDFEVDEKVGKTWPCDEAHEVLGATVAQDVELIHKGEVVGAAYWSGVVVKAKECPNACPHAVKVNYEVTFEFTHEEYKGEIVAGGVGEGIFSTATTKLAVLGGTGAFKGVTGTVTWTSGKPSTYDFDLWVPKHHKGSEEPEYEYKYIN